MIRATRAAQTALVAAIVTSTILAASPALADDQ